MDKFIMADGCALRVTDSEKGAKTVVLLHGYLESLEVWDEFGKLFPRELRVIKPDLPGHGISQVIGEIHTMEFLADTVRAVLRELNVEKCVVVGHSMGGYVALEMLNKYPDILEGVVLLHSTPNPDSEERRVMRQREIEIILEGKKELIARTTPDKGFAADNRKKFSANIEDLYEQITLTDDEGIVALLRGMSDRKDMNAVMALSKIPQMMIFGRKDEYITAETAQKIIEAQPQAKVVWLENSGHMGYIEEPEVTAKAISDFCMEIA